MNLSDQFRNGQDLVSVQLLDLVTAYLSETEGQRLLLPTIQRSLVWTNEKIVNYWDSLLRGWFPGLMLVHDAHGDAYDSKDKKVEAKKGEGDLELLDGQQRMAAILLGFGAGPLAKTRRLWIDLERVAKGPHRFTLRITSPGQPFGYKPDAPNSRLDVDQSRKAWDRWLFGPSKQGGEAIDWTKPQQVIDALRRRYETTLSNESNYELPVLNATDEDVSKALLLLRPHAFSLATGSDLRESGTNIFPLAPLMRRLAKAPSLEIAPVDIPVVEEFEALIASDKNKNAKSLNDAFAAVLHQPMAVKKVTKELFVERGAYEEFFKRIGQGGTALSDDELSYSLIKARIPAAREVLEAIVRDPKIGRLANPTQIALAGLRLARMRTMNSGNIWDRIGRPTPDFVSSLPHENQDGKDSGGAESDKDREKKKEKVELAHRFIAMLTPAENCELAGLMKDLRQLLGGGPNRDGKVFEETAFPAILLGHLPSEMIDIGLMLVGLHNLKDIDPKALRAFCLWCLTFGDAAQAANALAMQAIAEEAADTPPSGDDILRAVVKKLEDEGKANVAPTLDDIRRLRMAVPAFDDSGTGPLLRPSSERFRAEGVDQRIAVAMNEMRFRSRRGKNALLWLQREYLRRHFSTYDPTSDRDEDLPIDLDHVVPQERFAFWWQEGGFPLGQNRERLRYPENQEVLKNLWSYRGEIGNLLGNLRWLSSSENRSRGADMRGRGIESLKGDDDLIVDPDSDFECEDYRKNGDKRNLPKIMYAFGHLIDCEGEGGNARLGFSGWTTNDIRLWQYLVEMRQLELIRRLIIDSGIAGLLPEKAERENHHMR